MAGSCCGGRDSRARPELRPGPGARGGGDPRGVSAWVAKDQDATELETVIGGVVRGRFWFPPEMLGEILYQLRDDVCRAKEHDDLLGLLTRREREVLLRMVDGKRGRQIAQDLMISRNTVRTRIRNSFVKLDVHSRLEAVRMARATGLRPSDPPD